MTKYYKSSFNYELIERKLKQVFKASSIEYLGINHQNNKHEYTLTLEKIDGFINSQWTKSFFDASYFGISKSANTNGINIIVTVSNEDFERLSKEVLTN